MTQIVLTQDDKEKGRILVDLLYNSSTYLIRKEIKEMTPQEASHIWRRIEPLRPLIAQKSGRRKSQMKHNTVLRLMSAIEKKADAED